METSEDIKSIEQGSKKILQEKKVRLVRIINRLGRVIVERYKEGITSLLQDKEDRMISMQLALEIFLRDEFDEKLGPIDYVLSKRKKISLISIPIGKHLVLVSAEPNADVNDIVEKTNETFRNLLN